MNWMVEKRQGAKQAKCVQNAKKTADAEIVNTSVYNIIILFIKYKQFVSKSCQMELHIGK